MATTLKKTISFFANDEKGEVTWERARAAAPSIFADSPHPAVSSRYAFIDSRQILSYFTEEGYRLVAAHGGRRGKSREYGMHTLRFRAPFNNRMPGDLFPEVVFTNSHDRTSCGQLDLGVYRTECANGLVVNSGAGLSFRLPHTGIQKDFVLGAAQQIQEYVPKLSEVIRLWDARLLSEAEAREFARRASELKPGKKVSGDSLLLCRREADASPTLWRLFNRVQENILKGGIDYTSAQGRSLQTRPLTNVKNALKFNQDIWGLAEEFLPA